MARSAAGSESRIATESVPGAAQEDGRRRHKGQWQHPNGGIRAGERLPDSLASDPLVPTGPCILLSSATKLHGSGEAPAPACLRDMLMRVDAYQCTKRRVTAQGRIEIYLDGAQDRASNCPQQVADRAV